MQTEGKWCFENVKLLEAIIIGFISSDLIFILSHILLNLFIYLLLNSVCFEFQMIILTE